MTGKRKYRQPGMRCARWPRSELQPLNQQLFSDRFGHLRFGGQT